MPFQSSISPHTFQISFHSLPLPPETSYTLFLPPSSFHTLPLRLVRTFPRSTRQQSEQHHTTSTTASAVTLPHSRTPCQPAAPTPLPPPQSLCHVCDRYATTESHFSSPANLYNASASSLELNFTYKTSGLSLQLNLCYTINTLKCTTYVSL
ncbi:hypothetical protein E2C01_099099 [Portunus trituberculatus]|uniref:Uncharacterized protein n=1 Tax=Portunus trituberculatus TaxID=210409 RepID=A0A5B7KEJ0_PORTR|nr:hypothetical protein [Portunus trituberculatus]